MKKPALFIFSPSEIEARIPCLYLKQKRTRPAGCYPAGRNESTPPPGAARLSQELAEQKTLFSFFLPFRPMRSFWIPHLYEKLILS
jgi:hypothetical protein